MLTVVCAATLSGSNEIFQFVYVCVYLFIGYLCEHGYV